MKDYNQMAADALRRINEHKEIQRRRNRFIKIALIPAACLCLILAFGLRQKNATQSPIVLNEPGDMAMADIDARLTDYRNQSESEWTSALTKFHDFTGFRYEEFVSRFPAAWEISRFYSMSARNYKDADSQDKYLLHDYVFIWQTQTDGEVTIALCPFEAPLRDCIVTCDNPKQSEINGVSLTVYGYANKSASYYATQFAYQNMNYDIEANNITLAEFEELLSAIIH